MAEHCTLEKEINLEIEGLDLIVEFSVDVTIMDGVEGYNHFGNRGLRREKEFDFDLEEINSVRLEETGTEFKLTKGLEQKIQGKLHNWISEHCDTLAQEV